MSRVGREVGRGDREQLPERCHQQVPALSSRGEGGQPRRRNGRAGSHLVLRLGPVQVGGTRWLGNDDTGGEGCRPGAGSAAQLVMRAGTAVWFALLASTACSGGSKAADPVGQDAAPAAGRTESDPPASEVRPVSWTFLEHRDGALVTAASAGADTATIQRRFAALDVACGQDFPEGWSLRVEFVEGRTHAFSTTVPTARLTGCLADRLARVRLPSGRSGVMDATLGSPPSAKEHAATRVLARYCPSTR